MINCKRLLLSGLKHHYQTKTCKRTEKMGKFMKIQCTVFGIEPGNFVCYDNFFINPN